MIASGADYQNPEKILNRLVRIGTVSDVNNEKRCARVIFPEENQTSDWLGVLINRDYIPDYDGDQVTEEQAGGSFEASFESHSHRLTIKPWMPKIGEQVLVLYLPVRNSHGIILGGVQPWTTKA